ncbi:hypothetical protein BN1088_1660003 [Sphingobacterium sp. PM2-P1-29]|nr:hypothetical protein BN1088_1660003 [Sphingobacterium sp. PM2-P1-29]
MLFNEFFQPFIQVDIGVVYMSHPPINNHKKNRLVILGLYGD